MNTLRKFFILLVLFFPAIASAAGGSCTYYSPEGAIEYCKNYTGSYYTSAHVTAVCAVGGTSTYSTGDCSTTGAVGMCTSWVHDATMSRYSAEDVYYEPKLTSQAIIDSVAAGCTTSGTAVWTTFSVASTTTASTPLPQPPTSQTAYSASNGVLPSAAVQVAASGTYGSAKLNVTLNVAAALSATRSRTGEGYNVYVVAMLPGSLSGSTSPVIYVKSQVLASWQPLQWPMAAFMSNVAQKAVNDQVLIEILDNTNLLSLIGTEIYIGYGTSDQEMMSANRFRGVYKVQ